MSSVLSDTLCGAGVDYAAGGKVSRGCAEKAILALPESTEERLGEV
jgi:hypothetical protein